MFGIANEAEKGTVRERRKEERAIRMERENKREWHQSLEHSHWELTADDDDAISPLHLSTLFKSGAHFKMGIKKRERERAQK